MNDLNTIFNGYTPYINGWEKYKRASVTIPIVLKKDKPHILFEVRSKNLKSQPNEICFPGGKIEANETPLLAAVRETCEEIGINENNITIISSLDIFISPFNILIHPFLIEISSIDNIEYNTDEVEKLFLVPLDFLLTREPEVFINSITVTPDDNFPYEIIPQKKNYKFGAGSYETYFYTYEEHVIWGLTAKILENFLSILKKNNYQP